MTNEDERSRWLLADGVTFLNHGSFGPTTRRVLAAREEYSRRLAANPMQFLLREFEQELATTLERLAGYIGAKPSQLVMVDNATTAMNVVARAIDLQPGDEVVLNDHEYGAVMRIWREACERAGATVRVVTLPEPLNSTSGIVAALRDSCSERTRLVVVSHVTSPTAVVLPVAEIVREMRSLGIPVCIDGPHAIAMCPLDLTSLGADFYCASLHKWLSAPIGSGFLHVAPKWTDCLAPVVTSWGRSVSGRTSRWQDPFGWLGTRDPAPWLAVRHAIEELSGERLQRFRSAGHNLAREARVRLEARLGTTAIAPTGDEWFGTMVTVPLKTHESLRAKPNLPDPLQSELWQRFQIEIPIVDWHGRRHMRVSCHLYNSSADLDRLETALEDLSHLV